MHTFPSIRWDEIPHLPYGLFVALTDFIDQRTPAGGDDD